MIFKKPVLSDGITESTFECKRDGLTIRGTIYRPKGDHLPIAIVCHGFMAWQDSVKHYAAFWLKWDMLHLHLIFVAVLLCVEKVTEKPQRKVLFKNSQAPGREPLSRARVSFQKKKKKILHTKDKNKVKRVNSKTT